MIPFNKPYYSPETIDFIKDSLSSNHISGDGKYSDLIQSFFKEEYGLKNNLITTSCTDALELISLVENIKKNDEVILPSYTFVSTANPFLLRGANLIFADSSIDSPNIDLDHVRELVTKKTKLIIVVHYAGIACEMEKLFKLKVDFPHINIVEDAAQCVDSFYKGKPLGSFGDYAAFSFHETKNISCGEGGLFVAREELNFYKAEIIRDKGTNRKSFNRGKVDKYGWKNFGSSFLPSDILASILWAQLQKKEQIKLSRKQIWETYYIELKELEDKGYIQRPRFSKHSEHNFHIFYIVVKNNKDRNKLISYLANRKIKATFHYQSLHQSDFYLSRHPSKKLPNCERYTSSLIRLPIYNNMDLKDCYKVIENTLNFFN